MNEKPVIYCYPIKANAYIAKSINLWQSMGYNVRSCWKDLWRDRRAPRRDKIVILNWYEDWMFQSSRPKVLSLVWACALVLYFRVASSGIIWVRHNFKSHVAGRVSIPHRILIALLKATARRTVTHRPVAQFGSVVIPHPLVVLPEHVAPERDIEFLWFGMVRRYKALDQLLQIWPAERRLLILGRSDEAQLTAELQAIIASRKLNVDWQDRYIPDDELNEVLSRTKYVVMSHEDQSMIVSGVFYHAIAQGANILIRDSEFARATSAMHDFVHVYEDVTLADAMVQLQHTPPQRVVAAARQAYGDEPCRSAWETLFE